VAYPYDGPLHGTVLYLNATCGFALLAAIGTSGYSIADDEALRHLRSSLGDSLGNTKLTLLYACLEALSASLWLGLFVACRKDGRKQFRELISVKAKYAVLAGVAIHLTYAIVLVAMAFVINVSYVVGFRQMSIPLGAMAGVFVLKESCSRPKVIGVAIMFMGLILLALG
jgi:uncharacterized membrane protein